VSSLSENILKPISKASLPWWCYAIGFASLIPFLGLVFAFISLILGIIKIYQGGWKLISLAMLGVIITAGLTGFYYDSLFPVQRENEIRTSPAGTTAASDRIFWRNPADGLKESQRTRKPILYDFTAEWCGFCIMMKSAVFEKPEDAVKINRMYIPVVVMDRRREEGRNPGEISDLQSKYGIRAFPTLVIQYPGKSDYKMLPGFRGEDYVMNFLTQP
jgi:thiol:disulfide interchange protein